jgi:tripartite-type tricarboxylate transporter receptor subunit TctC
VLFAGSLLLVLASLSPSRAQPANYPNKIVTLVVPYGAGGSADVTARIFSERLSKVIEQPIVVENRPGIVVGTSYIARAAPDGYQFLAAPLAHSVNTTLYKKLPYDTLNDFASVATLGFFNFVVVVNPKLPVTNLKSLIAFLKSSRGKSNYGSGGVGTTSHIGVELFKSLTGTEAVHVPYRGDGQAVVDLMAGQIDFMLCSTPTCTQHIKSGALRALAVTSTKRFELLPEVPTSAEAGLPEFKILAYYTLLAPKDTPAAMVTKMARAVVLTLKDPNLQGRLRDLGFEVEETSTAASTSKLIADEAARWAPIIQAAGASAD